MDAVLLLEKEGLPVSDALAPTERLAVGVTLSDDDRVAVDDSVGGGVTVPLCVGEAV